MNMSAQNQLNAWGLVRYGKPGEYSVSLGTLTTYGSTLTGNDSFSVVYVYRNGYTIERMEDVNFFDLLNEMLQATP